MVIVCLNSASLFVDSDTYNPMDFSDMILTRAAPGGGNLGTINLANVAAVVQAPAVATVAYIAATLLAAFNSRNLPTDIQDMYDSFNNPTKFVTKTSIIAFNQPPGGCNPVLSYLDSPIGAEVMQTPKNTNRIITTRNGQFFLLANQAKNV